MRHALDCTNKVITAWFNSLPNDTILASSKFKAYADDKINVTIKN